VFSRQDWAQGAVSPQTIAAYAGSLLRDFSLADATEASLRLLLEMLALYGVKGRKVFDLHLVATMRPNRIPRLLTHNADDFKAYFDHIAVVPLIPATP
jgi:hypothetical protein